MPLSSGIAAPMSGDMSNDLVYITLDAMGGMDAKDHYVTQS